MNITFIGVGYVGLVSGTMLAWLGAKVTCCDMNDEKIYYLQQGKLPLYEPKLDKYITSVIQSGHLRFALLYADSCQGSYAALLTKKIAVEAHPTHVENADVVFITVGTPSLESGEADLSYLYDAVLQTARSYNEETLIVIKSTIPPGTCIKLEKMLRSQGYKHLIAANPEFLRQGNAINDFLTPDRIVLGTCSAKAEAILRSVYKPLTDKGSVILRTDRTTAELIKYASNAFLATKITFINEMANLCEKVNADVDLLAKGMGLDNRIGKQFLKAGPGFGGSCFPKDILALSHLAKVHNQPCHLLDAVTLSNQNRQQHMVNKIVEAMDDLNGKIICVFGITFKAETDDVRSSPAVKIVSILLSMGAKVQIYDPRGAKNAASLVPNTSFMSDPYEAAKAASCIVILTEWEEFKELNFEKLGKILAQPTVFDFRNMLDTKKLRILGFNYNRLGKCLLETSIQEYHF